MQIETNKDKEKREEKLNYNKTRCYKCWKIKIKRKINFDKSRFKCKFKHQKLFEK